MKTFFLASFKGCMCGAVCRRNSWLHLFLGIGITITLYTIGALSESCMTDSLAWLDADARGTLFLLILLPWFLYYFLVLQPSFLVRRLRDTGRSLSWVILWYLSLVIFPVWPFMWLYWLHIIESPSKTQAA